MEQDKRHIPHSSREPHNQQTRPAGTQDVDKLRENPHNDERVIKQDENKRSDADLKSNATYKQEDEGTHRVTNEQEQNEIVNPGPQRIENAKRDDDDDDDEDDDEATKQPTGPEIPVPETEPSTNPYEEIGDDPETTRKKIPKM